MSINVIDQINTTDVLDFSNMFKDCTNLEAVPSIDMLENDVLVWTCPDGRYYTYQGQYIYGEEGVGPDKRKTADSVEVLTSEDMYYKIITKKYPEFFI
jgi:hypothetical protein